MTAIELERTKKWVENWKTLGPELERMREEDIRNADTVTAMIQLSGAFRSAILMLPPRESSGLVEQQMYFARARA